MKAVVHTRYGSPDVLRLMEVERPVPKDGEVLIRVHATTVNRTDCGFLRAEPFFVRVVSGLLRPKATILGSELAGDVVAAGKDVTAFRPGDQVFGLTGMHFGAHAEYVCLPEDAAIAAKPANMDYDEAAAVSDGAMLAIAFIRWADLRAGKRVLVNGASGSIGSAAVQLATYYGAQVTAVGNAGSLDLLRSLGATRSSTTRKRTSPRAVRRSTPSSTRSARARSANAASCSTRAGSTSRRSLVSSRRTPCWPCGPRGPAARGSSSRSPT